MIFLLFLLVVLASAGVYFLFQIAKDVRELSIRGIAAVEKPQPVTVQMYSDTRTPRRFKTFSHQHQAAPPDDDFFIVWRWTGGTWCSVDVPVGARIGNPPNGKGRFEGDVARTSIA